MNILKSKLLWSSIAAVILVIIVILGLLKGCAPSELPVDAYTSEVTSLIDKNKSGQDRWNLLLGNTDFVDLCTEPYAAEFEALGQSFIDQASKFDQLKVKGDPNTVIPNYSQYVKHFSTYRQIGEKLQAFSSAIRSGNYKQALVLLDELEALNNQLPIIEQRRYENKRRVFGETRII
ncbi:hypothetical protein IA929_03980 [Listeria seeligeri]|uniref:hypothetical protein n=1 Tax=Listeria seeligeri TaxID=1640 RepID=UPI001888F038|nr:hypothetical protein [Listeria seeligeri]MBF2599160.1 hypothetical protein [Listeria seeligeri]